VLVERLRQTEQSFRRGRHQIRNRPRIEVIRMFVASEYQVHAAQLTAAERGGCHADVRPARTFVLPGQMLGKVRVDHERAGARLDHVSALTEPPDGDAPQFGLSRMDFVQDRVAARRFDVQRNLSLGYGDDAQSAVN
jgi:hypothetical protein